MLSSLRSIVYQSLEHTEPLELTAVCHNFVSGCCFFVRCFFVFQPGWALRATGASALRLRADFLEGLLHVFVGFEVAGAMAFGDIHGRPTVFVGLGP